MHPIPIVIFQRADTEKSLAPELDAATSRCVTVSQEFCSYPLLCMRVSQWDLYKRRHSWFKRCYRFSELDSLGPAPPVHASMTTLFASTASSASRICTSASGSCASHARRYHLSRCSIVTRSRSPRAVGSTRGGGCCTGSGQIDSLDKTYEPGAWSASRWRTHRFNGFAVASISRGSLARPNPGMREVTSSGKGGTTSTLF